MTSPVTTKMLDFVQDFRDKLSDARRKTSRKLRDISHTRPALFVRGLIQHQENRALLQKFGRAMFENLCCDLGLPVSQPFYIALAASARAIKTRDDLEGVIWTLKNLSRDTLRTLSRTASQMGKLINTPADLIRIAIAIDLIDPLLNGVSSSKLKGVHTIDELETACFAQPAIKAFIRRWGLPRVVKEINYLSDCAWDFKSYYLEALAQLSHLAGTSLDAFQALCKSIGEIDEYLVQIIPQLAGDIHSFDDLTAFKAISKKVRTLCREKAPAALSMMIDHPPTVRTTEAWEKVAMVCAKFHLPRQTLFFGEDPAQQAANKHDREYVLRLVKIFPTALLEADERFFADEEIVLTAIEGWAEAYFHADQSLVDSPGFSARAFEANFNTVQYMVDKTDSTGFRPIERDGDIDCEPVYANIAPSELSDQYAAVVAELKSLGIRFPERLNTKTAAAVIHDRKNIAIPDERPIALFIHPKHDKAKAFKFNQIQDFIEHGYRVLYFEVGNDEDLAAVEQELQAAKLENQVSVFRVGGHSAISIMSFGAPDPAKGKVDDPSRVFFAARPEEGIGKVISRFDAFLKPGALVFADGCGAGGGEGVITNVADSLAAKFPDSIVFAAGRRTKLTELRALFDEKKQVYWGGHPVLYVASMRKTADLSALIP